MLPVLLSLGPLTISSFGFFLALSFLLAASTIWRIVKAYDVDEEKAFDLVLLTFLGGLIGARAYFVAFHWQLFDEPVKILLINKYPGLSFWGAFVGGVLTMKLFAAKTKMNFWQIVDFSVVGLSLAIAVSNIGCFLGGCNYGVISNLSIAVPVVGLIGKRLPVALLESIIMLFVYAYLYRQVLKFHFAGKIAATFLLLLGLDRFILEFYMGDSRVIISNWWFSYSHLLSLATFIGGVVVFYTRSKRKIVPDLKRSVSLPFSKKRRTALFLCLKKNWYNTKIYCRVKIEKWLFNLAACLKKAVRKLNVKPIPTNIK